MSRCDTCKSWRKHWAARCELWGACEKQGCRVVPAAGSGVNHEPHYTRADFGCPAHELADDARGKPALSWPAVLFDRDDELSVHGTCNQFGVGREEVLAFFDLFADDKTEGVTLYEECYHDCDDPEAPRGYVYRASQGRPDTWICDCCGEPVNVADTRFDKVLLVKAGTVISYPEHWKQKGKKRHGLHAH